MSEMAVLNANYLLARLRDVCDLPFDRLCLHEFVLSARRLGRAHSVTALDLAIPMEAAEDPPHAREAPHHRPVRSLDEARRPERMIVKFGVEEHPDLSAELASVSRTAE